MSDIPTPHPRAVQVLVLGVLSIPCCGLFTGIPAVVLGRRAQADLAAARGGLSGGGAIQAGIVCGIIGTTLTVVGFVVAVVLRFVT